MEAETLRQTLDIAERIVRLSGDDIWTNYKRLKAAINDSVKKKKVSPVKTDFSCQAKATDDSWSFLETLAPFDPGASRSSHNLKKYVIDQVSSVKAKNAELSQLRRQIARLEGDARDTGRRVVDLERALQEANAALTTERATGRERVTEEGAWTKVAALQDELAALQGARDGEVEAAGNAVRERLAIQFEKERASYVGELDRLRTQLEDADTRHADELRAAERRAEDGREAGERKVAGLHDRLALQQLRISRLRAALGVDDEVTASASAKLRLLESPSPATPPKPMPDARVARKKGRGR